jgi:hypothetical protein
VCYHPPPKCLRACPPQNPFSAPIFSADCSAGTPERTVNRVCRGTFRVRRPSPARQPDVSSASQRLMRRPPRYARRARTAALAVSSPSWVICVWYMPARCAFS